MDDPAAPEAAELVAMRPERPPDALPAGGGFQPRPRAFRSAYARLIEEPRRFRFDAALRVLTRTRKTVDVADGVRFRPPLGVGYPPADVIAVEPGSNGAPVGVTTPVITLTGPTGVLPNLYTEALTTTVRNRSRALHEFLAALAHRTIAFFVQAAIKYRINRAAEAAASEGRAEQDPVSAALLAFTGYGTPGLVERLGVGRAPLLHYSGFFAGHPRSAERLAALTSDWLGRTVEVEQFVGAWLPLARDQRSRMPAGRRPGVWNRLGIDAAIGVRAWDPQARIILRIGPLDRASFAALLPDRQGLQQLVSLVRAYLGFEVGFAVNPVLAGPQIPPLILGPSADPPARLGWNTWVPAPPSPLDRRRRADAYDAIFEAEIVEAEEVAKRERR